jgi:hypothetical protein
VQAKTVEHAIKSPDRAIKASPKFYYIVEDAPDVGQWYARRGFE